MFKNINFLGCTGASCCAFGLKQKFISVTETLGSDRIPYTHSIDYVKQACAFINQQIGELEPKPIRNQGILNNPDEIY